MVAVLALGLLGARSAAASPGPRILVYGDSLVYEASPYADDLLRTVARVDGVIVGMPGGAICDLLPRMRDDNARYRPTAVVIAFSGNALTPCMEDADGQPLRGDAWLAKYRADTLAAVAAFPRVPAIWLGTAPISFFAEHNGEDDVHRLAAMERAVALSHPRVHVTDSAASVLDHGYWTRTLPCLPNEPCTGGVDAHGQRVNIVRAPDTAHFCPVPYPKLEQCPVYASGGLRYALGLLVPTLRAQGLYDQGRVAASRASGWGG